jgi:16S rRNA (guanine966-N2)-methyltransferase
MRVIAGKFRSRRLKSPGSLRLRPTSDRLRETLFNVLGPTTEDSLFIDLYSGTGAIGIEAVSRGAREVIFVEKHPAIARLLRQNLDALEIRSGIELITADAGKALAKLAARHIVADFIFLDPPYDDHDQYESTLEFLNTSHLLAPATLVIAEHFDAASLPDRYTRLERVRVIEQGEAALSFYKLAAAA